MWLYDGYWYEYHRDPDEKDPPNRYAKSNWKKRIIKTVRDAGLAPTKKLAREYILQTGGYEIFAEKFNITFCI